MVKYNLNIVEKRTHNTFFKGRLCLVRPSDHLATVHHDLRHPVLHALAGRLFRVL